MLDALNWPAVLVGTAIAFGLGWLWYGPIFGKAWATGSHGITPPDKFPMLAMTTMLAGTFLLALVIGITATTDALGTAVAAILASAVLSLSIALFSQKSAAAALIDGGYIVAMGVVMIAAQGIL